VDAAETGSGERVAAEVADGAGQRLGKGIAVPPLLSHAFHKAVVRTSVRIGNQIQTEAAVLNRLTRMEVGESGDLPAVPQTIGPRSRRSEEHTSELQSR